MMRDWHLPAISARKRTRAIMLRTVPTAVGTIAILFVNPIAFGNETGASFGLFFSDPLAGRRYNRVAAGPSAQTVLQCPYSSADALVLIDDFIVIASRI